MRRRPRRLSPSGLYHFGSRGSNEELIYFDELDYAIWRRQLARVAHRRGWAVLAWTQMPNHFHVVARVSEGTLSSGMQELNYRYSRGTNARHGRRAHLFENRFWSEVVDSHERLLTAVGYVDVNPYRSARRIPPSEWPHGSHRAVAGLEHPPAFLATGDLLALFHADPAKAVTLYREFVQGAMARVDQARSQATVTEL